jgi:hypothetical protein
MTGDGIREDRDHDGRDSDEFCKFYIGANGADGLSTY